MHMLSGVHFIQNVCILAGSNRKRTTDTRTHTHANAIIHIFRCCCFACRRRRHRCLRHSPSSSPCSPLIISFGMDSSTLCAHFHLLVRSKRFTLFFVCSFVPAFEPNLPTNRLCQPHSYIHIHTHAYFQCLFYSLSFATHLRFLLHSTSIVRFGKSVPLFRSVYFWTPASKRFKKHSLPQNPKWD